MDEEKSAGAIIFRIHGNNPLYLILYKKPRLQYRRSWDFPKGNVEKDESVEDTAKREILEETGISEMNFVKKFKEDIKFFYMSEGKLTHKTITFLLAETNQEQVTISYEHNEYKWCDYEEAIKLLTHKNSKEILTKANEFLKEYIKQRRLF